MVGSVADMAAGMVAGIAEPMSRVCRLKIRY
jgi:hypothetical protein